MSSRSRFVTVLAWVTIVIAGVGTLASLAQSFNLIQLRPGGSERVLSGSEEAEIESENPSSRGFLSTALQVGYQGIVGPLLFAFTALVGAFPLVALVLFLLLLASALGLWRRQRWARYAFLAFLLFAAGLDLYGTFIQAQGMVHSFNLTAGVRPEASGVHTQAMVTHVLGLLRSLGILVLLALVFAKLTTAQIKDEFAPRAPGS